jgi:hypothetical protein
MLAALAKRTVPDVAVVNIATPFDLDAVNDSRSGTQED